MFRNYEILEYLIDQESVLFTWRGEGLGTEGMEGREGSVERSGGRKERSGEGLGGFKYYRNCFGKVGCAETIR